MALTNNKDAFPKIEILHCFYTYEAAHLCRFFYTPDFQKSLVWTAQMFAGEAKGQSDDQPPTWL